jgi:hypothetical protein
MDRAGGIYKRNTRRVLLVVGFIVASFLNLDTLQIIQTELASPAKLSQSVDQITKEIPKIKFNKDATETVNIQTTKGTVAVDTKIDSTKKADTAAQQVRELTLYLGQTSGYTLGYSAGDGFVKQWTGKTGQLGDFLWSVFLKKLLGLLITAFALQLSSSFWFDLMSKAVNVRAAGAKPDKKPDA